MFFVFTFLEYESLIGRRSRLANRYPVNNVNRT